MKIAIASGKGGTGKTTVAVNLALAGGGVQLLDCDVEDPDVAIFLRPTTTSTRSVGVDVPRIDTQRCTYCGECSRACAFDVLIMVADRFFLNEAACKDCGACYLACPEQALVPQQREIGTISHGEVADSITLVTGSLTPGEVMASPLIERVLAEARHDRPVLIDCPPGTACSMVHAISGADLCVMVTEPTPYGHHDLAQALDVAHELRVPTAVVINRSDLGDSGVRALCHSRGVPVLLEIPFDQALARAYANGRTAIEEDPRWLDTFRDLRDRIFDLVSTPGKDGRSCERKADVQRT